MQKRVDDNADVQHHLLCQAALEVLGIVGHGITRDNVHDRALPPKLPKQKGEK
jgi:hypothetical protein